ncbi:MAG: hypothetical protein ABIQ31_15945 [Ferruginibacter sp.]
MKTFQTNFKISISIDGHRRTVTVRRFALTTIKYLVTIDRKPKHVKQYPLVLSGNKETGQTEPPLFAAAILMASRLFQL